MSVGTLCQVCNAAGADRRCDRCGGVVCEDHLDESVGVCVECTSEFPGTGGGADGDRGEGHPDVDRYRF